MNIFRLYMTQFVKESVSEMPVMKMKKGKIQSVGVIPCHRACLKGASACSGPGVVHHDRPDDGCASERIQRKQSFGRHLAAIFRYQEGGIQAQGGSAGEIQPEVRPPESITTWYLPTIVEYSVPDLPG